MCLLILLFSACQKEMTEPNKQLLKPLTSTTLTNELQKKLPNNVSIKAIPNASNRYTDEVVPSFPTDTPLNCQYNNCFQLTDTYLDLQGIANQNCSLIQKRICCCFEGQYNCFMINVLPNEACQDTSKIESLDAIMIDKIEATSLESGQIAWSNLRTVSRFLSKMW